VVDANGEVWIDLPRRERYDISVDPGQQRNLYVASFSDEADALFARHPRAWPPHQSVSMLDQEQAEQLAALGYLAGRTGAAFATSAPRPDPKDILPVAALWMGQDRPSRPDEALAEAERLALRFGALPALAFFRADRLLELSRPAEAIAVLLEASEAHPQEERLREELESLRRTRAEDEELAKRIRRVWADQPDHPGAVHDLAVVLHRLGEIDEAEALYRTWLERHPDDATTRLDLSRILGGRGALEEALLLLREVPAGSQRDAKLDCAEGQLLAWWMARPEDAKPLLQACRD
jgi:tetratricopeptide (TPR) repeat protein